jgi:hypothetical protein
MKVRFICERHEVDLHAEDEAEPMIKNNDIWPDWEFNFNDFLCPQGIGTCMDSWIVVGLDDTK